MQQSAADARADKQYQNDIAARDEQRAYDRDAYVRLVADAEKAGFNPLTALRNGGGVQYGGPGYAPLSKQEASGDYMGAAVSRVGDVLANFDPFADTKREQESRLIESQISALNASTLSGVKHGRGSFASGDFDVSAPRKAGGLSSSNGLGKRDDFKANQAQVTNPWKWFDVNTNLADGSSYEDRYGELGGAALGLTTLLGDVGQNVWNYTKHAYSKGYFGAARTVLDPFAKQWMPKVKAKSGNGGGGW